MLYILIVCNIKWKSGRLGIWKMIAGRWGDEQIEKKAKWDVDDGRKSVWMGTREITTGSWRCGGQCTAGGDSAQCALCTAHTSTLLGCNTSVCRGKVQKAHQAHQCTPDTMQVNLCALQAQQGCQCWGGMPGKSIGRSCRFTQTTIKCLKLPFWQILKYLKSCVTYIIFFKQPCQMFVWHVWRNNKMMWFSLHCPNRFSLPPSILKGWGLTASLEHTVRFGENLAQLFRHISGICTEPGCPKLLFFLAAWLIQNYEIGCKLRLPAKSNTPNKNIFI